MNDIFNLRNTDKLTRDKYKLTLEIPKPNQATFGTRSLRSYGPKIWNALPYHIKTSDDLNSFKAIIKCWDRNHCTCINNGVTNGLKKEEKMQNSFIW